MAKRKSRNSLYTIVIVGAILLLSLTLVLVAQSRKSQELRSRAFDPYASPYPTTPPPPGGTIKPNPKPRYIVLNSASNKSCSAVCAELGARCSSVGTTLTAEGKANGKMATKTLGSCELKNATCSTVMKPVGPPGTCFGQTPEWTFCGCVGRNE